MIKFENTEVMGWEHAIRGMRNPMNSWEKSDSRLKGPSKVPCSNCTCLRCDDAHYEIGPNDLDLMRRLAAGGPVHAKYRRMITVYVDITAPLYWWKEFDTYKVGTVANSCSTMHKIHAKEFTLEDFSCEHLIDELEDTDGYSYYSPKCILEEYVIPTLNVCRERYLETKDKKYWWQMIQLLPSSYNQKRTVMLNYEVLANIYKSRKNHKLDEWAEHMESTCPVNENTICNNPKEFLLCEDCSVGKGFCDWIKTLPYSELITGTSLSDIPIANEIMEEAEKRLRSTTAGLDQDTAVFGADYTGGERK